MEPAGQTAERLCSACGQRVTPDDRICPNCDTWLEGVAGAAISAQRASSVRSLAGAYAFFAALGTFALLLWQVAGSGHGQVGLLGYLGPALAALLVGGLIYLAVRTYLLGPRY